MYSLKTKFLKAHDCMKSHIYLKSFIYWLYKTRSLQADLDVSATKHFICNYRSYMYICCILLQATSK